MCPYCESCIKCAKHTQNIQKRPRNSNLSPKRYLIMNKIRDDDRIIQIATERGYSCGERRHAILLTAHSTFTQQTQYTDNMATLNERQFFLLGVATWGQDAKIGKIGHLGWPARVGFRGGLVKPSLDPRALVSPLVPCIGVRLFVAFAAYCSPRGWSRDGAENSKKGKNWQRGTHRKLHSSG